MSGSITSPTYSVTNPGTNVRQNPPPEYGIVVDNGVQGNYQLSTNGPTISETLFNHIIGDGDGASQTLSGVNTANILSSASSNGVLGHVAGFTRTGGSSTVVVSVKTTANGVPYARVGQPGGAFHPLSDAGSSFRTPFGRGVYAWKGSAWGGIQHK